MYTASTYNNTNTMVTLNASIMTDADGCFMTKYTDIGHCIMTFYNNNNNKKKQVMSQLVS